MTISIFGAVVALFLLIIPLYAFYALGIRLSRHLLLAVVRMLTALGVAGAAMKLAMMADHIAVTLLIALLLIVAAALLSVARSGVKMAQSLLPTLIGMGVSVIAVVAFLCIVVISSPQIMSPFMLISIVALVCGGCIVPVSDAIAAYYAGARHHAGLYNYLVGNGIPANQALNYLLKRAVQRATVPSIRYIGGMMVASQPVMMWTMLASGTSLSTSIAWQVVLAVAILSASAGAVMLSLLLARRLSIDEYSCLKGS